MELLSSALLYPQDSRMLTEGSEKMSIVCLHLWKRCAKMPIKKCIT